MSKSTVNNVLRKELNFHYLKTCYKTNYLKKEPGILFSFESNLKPIFIDESKIQIINNHFKCWRLITETIHFGDPSKKKNNLLLAVGKDFVLHYKITQENTNRQIFLEFLKEINKKILANKNKKYFLIMDNLVCHKNDEVIKFLVKSKLCIIFNAPYNSIFNAIELSFMGIKQKIYSNLYNTIEDVKVEIKNYLENKEISLTLLANYIRNS